MTSKMSAKVSDGTSRRSFLLAAGAAALGLGGGVTLVRAFASDILSEADEGTGPRWAMIVDTKKCSVADDCTVCSDACHKIHNVPSLENREEEIKWIWREDFEHVFPDQKHEYVKDDLGDRHVPVLCNHCENPPCVRVCPTKATWKRDDGIVMMDMHRCVGCRYCIVGCPYGSRSFNFSDPRDAERQSEPLAINDDYPTRDKGVVEKCNFCAEKGRDSEDGTWTPECVSVCPQKALMFGDIHDPESEIRKVLADSFTILRRPELGTRPHVFYIV